MAGKPRQTDALLEALAAGCSQAEASRRTGLSTRTIARRLADESFKRQITAARDRMVDNAHGRIADVASKAVTTLEELLTDDSPTIRLGAARAVLEGLTRLREGVELQRRLVAIEDALAARS